jgi:PTS system mannose-specific IIA component
LDKLILVSHGQFCSGIKDSLEMILGPQEQVYTLPLLEEEGEADLRQKFNDIVNADDNITVFADLLGGTPANVMSRLIMEGQNFDLFTGMNLPMVISYINGIMVGQSEDYQVKAQEGIVHVNEMLNNMDDEDE